MKLPFYYKKGGVKTRIDARALTEKTYSSEQKRAAYMRRRLRKIAFDKMTSEREISDE
jgi:hypothetical protein